MATFTPDVSNFEEGDNNDIQQPTDSVDSSEFKQNTELDKGDCDGIQQPQGFPVNQEKEEKSPEMESLDLGVVQNFETSCTQKLEDLSSAEERLRDVECENKTLKEKVEEMETSCTQKLEDLSSAEERLRDVECENKTLKEKLEEMDLDLKKKEEKLESLQEAHEVLLIEKDMKEMENFYKEKLKKTEEELKSFRKRMAAGVAVSLKTGGLESLNNPVSKTRLTEMYDNLKLLQWPKVTDQLKSSKLAPEPTKATIQETFKVAHEEMKKKKQQIEEAFGLTESSNELATQKVKELKQLAVQNLQMALFHTNKDLLKSGLPELEAQYSEEVKYKLRALLSECYWLSCLMALNNPPLQPDWKNLGPSMDPWNIFPRDIVEK